MLNIDDLPMKGQPYVDLVKDDKVFSRCICIDPLIQVPFRWKIDGFNPIETYSKSEKFPPARLPYFRLSPASKDKYKKAEWALFTRYLHQSKKAALVRCDSFNFYILPPEMGSSDVVVLYQCKNGTSDRNQTIMRHKTFANTSTQKAGAHGYVKSSMEAPTACRIAEKLPLSKEVDTTTSVVSEEIGDSFENVKGKESTMGIVKVHNSRLEETVQGDNSCEAVDGLSPKSRPLEIKQDDSVKKNYARTDPSYLRTLGQTHSGWIFGAIAELIDNSKDARASKLEIFIEPLYSKRHGKEIPVLSVFDDGHGMSHEEIVTMLSFGRKAPDADDLARIGRFGIGFKTGAMKIGRDAVVLTQTSISRSVAFLSQSLNEGKDNLEIPIVSYCRQGSVMEVDTDVQSEATANCHLKVIKEFSPFNEYLIGEKLAKFRDKGTGTQIYIWNLDEWGSNYCLEWQNGESPSHVADILIRSRRIRSRPGQISQKVPLDYSLRSYLEVIFLDPRMKIFVQGSVVKSRPLAKSLNTTTFLNGHIMGKPVQLTLGRSQREWEHMNCGIFLYWHGRLIEAYKRVGVMVHNADMGRGVIGVIDVTELMDEGKHVWVHNHKQGFQDCEVYAKLEEWLGNRADEYWDNNFDVLHVEKSSEKYEPDNDWVQCDKCRKWRMLISGYDISTLPQEWFCYMPPYNGRCDNSEDKADSNVITVGAKRSGCFPKQENEFCRESGKQDDRKNVLDDNLPSQTKEKRARQVLKENKVDPISNARRPMEENQRQPFKRLKKGLKFNTRA